MCEPSQGFGLGFDRIQVSTFIVLLAVLTYRLERAFLSGSKDFPLAKDVLGRQKSTTLLTRPLLTNSRSLIGEILHGWGGQYSDLPTNVLSPSNDLRGFH